MVVEALRGVASISTVHLSTLPKCRNNVDTVVLTISTLITYENKLYNYTD